MSGAASEKKLVLIGGGHANVFVLEAFARNPCPGLRLALVTPSRYAIYSGMIPGFVAGHYKLEQCQIDLANLADRAGAELITGSATGIDRAARLVEIGGQRGEPYDLLSIDVGIAPDVSPIGGAAEHALIVKPVADFADKWRTIERLIPASGGPRSFTAIGGGAAGFELILAMRHRCDSLVPAAKNTFAFTLVAGGELLAGHTSRTRSLARRALERYSITLIENDPVKALRAGRVELASGRTIQSSISLVSTKAAPPKWFDRLALPKDAAGYLALRPALQLLDDDDIFAAGDCASVLDHPREKAGVFAVRQGPVLAANLRRRAVGEAVADFTPQRRYLSLLALGDKRAIASRGALAFEADYLWTLKDRIDKQFVERFNGRSAN